MGEFIARFKPGGNVPGYASADVIGGRFVEVAGNKTANGDYNLRVVGTAGNYAMGVAERDALATEPAHSTERRFNVVRRGAIARVTAGGAITAGGPVKSDATGKAIAQAGSGVILGYAMNTVAADGDVVEVDLI